MTNIKTKHNYFYEVRELIESGTTNNSQIASLLNVSERTVRRHVAELKRTGFDPDNERFHKNPEEQIVKGYSTLQRLKESGDGSAGKVLEWVKTNVKLQDQYDAAQNLLNNLIKQVQPVEKVKFIPRKRDSNRFTVIPIGDPHIGLKVWQNQTGNEWDLEIAQRVFKNVIERLLQNSPDTEECILVNTGDFFHCDNITATSTRSGHQFDMDGTPGMWLDTGMVVMRMIVDACLRKYKTVHFVNVPGNHDDLLGRMIGGFIEQVYLHNDRVTVQKGDDSFQYVRRGNVLLGFAHGHTCRLPSLPGKMADDQAVLWGQTTYRQWFTGHVHHNQWQQYKEHPGCKVETVGILAPKDSYAHGGCYGAGRSIQSVIFDAADGYQPARYMETVLLTD